MLITTDSSRPTTLLDGARRGRSRTLSVESALAAEVTPLAPDARARRKLPVADEASTTVRRSDAPAMLLCLSSGHRRILEEPVEAAGEVALEAAERFAPALALLDPPVDVGVGWWVHTASGYQDLVERPVEFAVAATVKVMSDRLAGGGRDRGDAGETGECFLARHATLMRPRDDELGGAERADSRPVEQLRCESADERLDFSGELAFLDRQDCVAQTITFHLTRFEVP
jgi:hypothetical protein